MSYYPARILYLIGEIENHCPCGARLESLATHPHVTECPVLELKQLLHSWFAQEKFEGASAK
jgi:hypothetical protein